MVHHFHLLERIQLHRVWIWLFYTCMLMNWESLISPTRFPGAVPDRIVNKNEETFFLFSVRFQSFLRKQFFLRLLMKKERFCRYIFVVPLMCSWMNGLWSDQIWIINPFLVRLKCVTSCWAEGFLQNNQKKLSHTISFLCCVFVE